MKNPAHPASNVVIRDGEVSSILHASCVEYQKSAVLIIGPSGAGKSSLALQLMALGAGLVSDDITTVERRDDGVIAKAPASIKGLIEARGVGVLAADTCDVAFVRLVVDLERDETDRLPPHRSYNLLGQTLPLLHNVHAAHFAAAILQHLKGGRSA